MKAILTPLNVLYAIMVFLTLSCIIETVQYCTTTLRIKRWKPDKNKMHYTIRTASENCVPHFTHNEESDSYIVEYREMLTGRLILTQVLSVEDYVKLAKIESVNIEVSTLRIYIVSPNQHVIYKDFVRTDRNPNYMPFREKDISTNILLLAAEHFKRKCPLKRNISQKKESDIRYVEGLPLAVKNANAKQTVKIKKV